MILRQTDVLDRTKLSRSKLYELIGEGRFPKPAKLGGDRINCWRDTDIEEWINAQFAQG